ncbi:MAG: undecaprenyl-diphosphate phosphatase [Balneolaceae bacterium]|nr:undecaprenyl-diphosphate phosphatase [Balneolaceae bacterium]
MSILDAVLLGVLQGIAEFLPISSSGHLVVAQEVLGISSPGVTFEIMVHAGTLGSILWYYASDITNIARGLLRPSQVLPTQESSWQWVGWILLSMIPAMVVGVGLREPLEELFENPVWVGGFLMATGLMLLSTRWIQVGRSSLSWRKALMMGLFQALAILPGISRAGSTITAGLLVGLPREEAARFSFLMVIPVIGGATLLELIDLFQQGGFQQEAGLALSGQIVTLSIGFLTSLVVGLASLSLLVKLLKQNSFHHFGWYCLVIGAAAVAWFIR